MVMISWQNNLNNSSTSQISMCDITETIAVYFLKQKNIIIIIMI